MKIVWKCIFCVERNLKGSKTPPKKPLEVASREDSDKLRFQILLIQF